MSPQAARRRALVRSLAVDRISFQTFLALAELADEAEEPHPELRSQARPPRPQAKAYRCPLCGAAVNQYGAGSHRLMHRRQGEWVDGVRQWEAA